MDSVLVVGEGDGEGASAGKGLELWNPGRVCNIAVPRKHQSCTWTMVVSRVVLITIVALYIPSQSNSVSSFQYPVSGRTLHTTYYTLQILQRLQRLPTTDYRLQPSDGFGFVPIRVLLMRPFVPG